jgi:hypothetical protein
MSPTAALVVVVKSQKIAVYLQTMSPTAALVVVVKSQKIAV